MGNSELQKSVQQTRYQTIYQSVLRLITIALTMIFFHAISLVAQAQIYYLGVLAPQGESAAQRRWQPWLDEINSQLAKDTIVLVPLALENWQQQIEARQFAFVLGPQVQFIKMDTTGWRWLATVQTATSQTATSKNQLEQVPFYPSTPSLAPAPFQGTIDKGTIDKGTTDQSDPTTLAKMADELNELNHSTELSAMEQVASALWVRADSDIYRLQDLQQRKVVAVDKDAFGGYLLIAHLLQQNGIAPSRYQTQFVGYPVERTLSTLASGAMDAAIAPLCLMEEMARQGKIDQSKYRLVHSVKTASKCQSSTKIYPNWTLAATAQAPASLVSQVNQNIFLRSESSNNTGQSEATRIYWLPPESSADAERILYDMNRHPSQKQLGTHIIDWIYAHRWWVGVIAFIIVISTINYGWMSWLAWRRRRQILEQNRLIREYDHRLKQSERFAVIGEMSGSIAHEINQPLATIQNYAQGLLIRSQKASADNDNKANSKVGDKNSLNSLSHSANKGLENSNEEQKHIAERKTLENALQQIINETTRVAAVIGNIRRWAGKTQADEISVDIAETYQHCIFLLGEKAVNIRFWYASDYQQLQLPSLLLDQLLINTMLNAQQQGAAHIMLRCHLLEEGDASGLVVHITDDAGGFDASRLSPTQSASLLSDQTYMQSDSTKIEGLGLGLMICQRLCRSIGGDMQLSNVDVQQELECIKALDNHRQQYLKHTLEGKAQLIRTDSTSPWANSIGAQVSFYLPFQTTSATIKDSDKNLDTDVNTGIKNPKNQP